MHYNMRKQHNSNYLRYHCSLYGLRNFIVSTQSSGAAITPRGSRSGQIHRRISGHFRARPDFKNFLESSSSPVRCRWQDCAEECLPWWKFRLLSLTSLPVCCACVYAPFPRSSLASCNRCEGCQWFCFRCLVLSVSFIKCANHRSLCENGLNLSFIIGLCFAAAMSVVWQQKESLVLPQPVGNSSVDRPHTTLESSHHTDLVADSLVHA